MRSFTLILLMAVSLAYAAGRLPARDALTPRQQAIAARQVTRSQIIHRKALNQQGLGRRQAQPSGGVYARCASGNQDPGPNAVVYSVVRDVQMSNAGGAFDPGFIASSGQDCARRCFENSSCQTAIFNPADNNVCYLYGAVTRPQYISPNFVSTYKGKDCATTNADFQVLNPGQGSISCCNYYGNPA